MLSCLWLLFVTIVAYLMLLLIVLFDYLYVDVSLGFEIYAACLIVMVVFTCWFCVA